MFRNAYGECLLSVIWMCYVNAGDAAARGLLGKLLQAGAAPYFKMLERWLCEGVLDDPYFEFMVEENTVTPYQCIKHQPSWWIRG